jgi:hypothetical protein
MSLNSVCQTFSKHANSFTKFTTFISDDFLKYIDGGGECYMHYLVGTYMHVSNSSRLYDGEMSS